MKTHSGEDNEELGLSNANKSMSIDTIQKMLSKKIILLGQH